jgi:DNA-binding transcriptional ArsR family regulator
MLESLFGSKTRVKILALLLTNPGHAYYVREITRNIEEQINSVRRELLNLKALGIVKSQEKRGKIYFEANQKFEFFNELKKIFDKAEKNMGSDDKLTIMVKKAGDIQYASLSGVFVSDHANQVDLFVVGEVDKRKFKAVVNELEKTAGKEINYCLMSESEYEDRAMLFDRFLTEIMNSPKKILVNYLKAEEEAE